MPRVKPLVVIGGKDSKFIPPSPKVVITVWVGKAFKKDP
jgi:hypothetical protein